MHLLKQLKTKKGRDETGLFIVEGEKYVAEIPPHWEIIRYITSQTFKIQNEKILAQYKQIAPVETLRDPLFESFSTTLSPQGIVAIVRQKVYYMPNTLSGNFFLLGESLQDPGNIGTLIRTAAAAGANSLILTEGSADLYNPKVQRAAAGAALRLPIITKANPAETLAFFKHQGILLYAAHPRGRALPYETDMKKGFCLLIGNEAHGLSTETLAQADARIRLPMLADSESLNASVAGSILLYEAVRQRMG